MYDCFTKPIDWFRQFGDVKETKHGPLIYRDRGSKILGVAHLDHVLFSEPKKVGRKVYCPQLDDRLGAWIMLQMNCDILLTDSEETGDSTAQYFEPTKDYNWMFSFDRRGRDVVMYDYETEEYQDILAAYNFKVGWGSFSDICSLKHLGVAGFNFGTGYYNEHTNGCYANLDHTQEMLNKFRKFYNEMRDSELPVWADWDTVDEDGMDTSWITEEDDRYSPWNRDEEFNPWENYERA